MIGEIRDLETASIAINASLTGHLVFSTLHTNDAPGAVTRLIDIGCEAVPRGIFHPRADGATVVRKFGRKCAAPYMPTEAELRA